MWMVWRKPSLSEAELEVTASIKALKTLEVHRGRVSVSPSEVLDRPGYLEARKDAAALVSRGGKTSIDHRFDSWTDVDSFGIEVYMNHVRTSLVQLRAKGIPLGQARRRLADTVGS